MTRHIPSSGPGPPGAGAIDPQGDLFDEHGPVVTHPQPKDPAPPTPPPASLSDDDLAARIRTAGPSDVEELCREAIKRSLSAAVPALEALWRRFHGYGIRKALPEQRAVLETLARLKTSESRAALCRIVRPRALPDSLLPFALPAAVDAGLALPNTFVHGFLEHDDPAVRGGAFALAPAARVPTDRLRIGLSDEVASIQVTVAVALAHRGDAAGKDILLAELARAPSNRIIDALGVIGDGDGDVIVPLGRCAKRHAAFAPRIIAILREMEDPKARRLAARLDADRGDQGGAEA